MVCATNSPGCFVYASAATSGRIYWVSPLQETEWFVSRTFCGRTFLLQYLSSALRSCVTLHCLDVWRERGFGIAILIEHSSGNLTTTPCIGDACTTIILVRLLQLSHSFGLNLREVAT